MFVYYLFSTKFKHQLKGAITSPRPGVPAAVHFCVDFSKEPCITLCFPAGPHTLAWTSPFQTPASEQLGCKTRGRHWLQCPPVIDETKIGPSSKQKVSNNCLPSFLLCKSQVSLTGRPSSPIPAELRSPAFSWGRKSGTAWRQQVPAQPWPLVDHMQAAFPLWTPNLHFYNEGARVIG